MDRRERVTYGSPHGDGVSVVEHDRYMLIETKYLMVRSRQVLACALILAFLPGCTLVEVRSKSKMGPEFRHHGSDRTNSIRWYAQQGFEFVWHDDRNNKITTGITYRRRDVDNGNSDNDNGVWFDFSFPLWKADTNFDPTGRRMELLERRIAALEAGHDRASGAIVQPDRVDSAASLTAIGAQE